MSEFSALLDRILGGVAPPSQPVVQASPSTPPFNPNAPAPSPQPTVSDLLQSIIGGQGTDAMAGGSRGDGLALPRSAAAPQVNVRGRSNTGLVAALSNQKAQASSDDPSFNDHSTANRWMALLGGLSPALAPLASHVISSNQAKTSAHQNQIALARRSAEADQIGLTGREREVFMLNPEEWSKQSASRYAASDLAGGSTRMVLGDNGNSYTAPKTEKFDDRFGTIKPDTGETSYSQPRDPTFAEMTDRNKPVNVAAGGAVINPVTGAEIYKAPEKVELHGFPVTDTIYQTGGGQPATGGQAFDPDVAKRVLSETFGPDGYKITSAFRTPEHNAAVGGVPTSDHLRGGAFDIVVPGHSSKDTAAALRSKGVPGQILDEGDHVHWSFAHGGGASTGGGPTVIKHGEAPADMTPRQAAQTEMTFRKEFDGQPDVKNFNDVAASYEQVSRLGGKQNPTPGDDLALTYSFMKMLDPGSVVREGEFAMVGRTAGLPDQVIMALQRVDRGQGLTPQIRANLLQAAQGVYQGRKGRYDQLVGQYQGYAERMGLPKDVITPRIGVGEKLPGWSKNLPKPQLQAAMQFKGSTAPQGSQNNPFLPTNAQQFRGLPKGAWYVDDDGSIHQKVN